MKQTINYSRQFAEAFHAAGRGEQFSYQGLCILFEYLEQCDPDMELDVVAICCDYSEEMPESIAENYSINIHGFDDGEILDEVMEFLENHTSIVGTTDAGAIVYQQF